MPGEDRTAPTEPLIDLAQNLSENEHSVIVREIKSAELVRCSDRTVVRVVKQQLKAPAIPPLFAKLRDQVWIIPLMHDDDRGVVQRLVEIKRREIVIAQDDAWHQPRGFSQGIAAAVLLCIAAAPSVRRLTHDNLVPQPQKLARHSAKEVRIAVIPARYEGMIEHHEFHGRASIVGRGD